MANVKAMPSRFHFQENSGQVRLPSLPLLRPGRRRLEVLHVFAAFDDDAISRVGVVEAIDEARVLCRFAATADPSRFVSRFIFLFRERSRSLFR